MISADYPVWPEGSAESEKQIERVARAMFYSGGTFLPGAWDLTSEVTRHHNRNKARAAIEAMRDPTEAVLEAGPPEPYMDADVWRSMIDAALKD